MAWLQVSSYYGHFYYNDCATMFKPLHINHSFFTGGTEGVIKAYDILKTELDRAMGLLGTGTVDELKKRGPGLIKRRHASARDYPDRYAYERGYGGGVI